MTNRNLIKSHEISLINLQDLLILRFLWVCWIHHQSFIKKISGQVHATAMLLVAKGHLKVDEARRYWREDFPLTKFQSDQFGGTWKISEQKKGGLFDLNVFCLNAYIEYSWMDSKIFSDWFWRHTTWATHRFFIDFFFTNGCFVDVLVRARFCSLRKLKRAGSCCFYCWTWQPGKIWTYMN